MGKADQHIYPNGLNMKHVVKSLINRGWDSYKYIISKLVLDR